MVNVGVMRSNITIYGCYEGGYGSISPSTLTIGGKQVAFSELYLEKVTIGNALM